MYKDIFESIRNEAEKRNLRERTIQLYCSDVPHEHTLREVGYFAGGYQAVHLGAYRGGFFPLVYRHALPFLQHLSETLGKDFRRFTDYLTAEHVTHSILDNPAFLVPVITGKLAVILKA